LFPFLLHNPHTIMSRRHLGRSRSFPSGVDSFPSAGHARKDLQLCRQVADTLQLALGDCGDDVLRDLHVVRVVPAPDASQLLVIVGSAPGDLPPPPGDVLGRLKDRTSWLRGEVAHAITRKRAPALLFEYLATMPEERREGPG
jgi:ribosome-binding factor A